MRRASIEVKSVSSLGPDPVVNARARSPTFTCRRESLEQYDVSYTDYDLTTHLHPEHLQIEVARYKYVANSFPTTCIRIAPLSQTVITLRIGIRTYSPLHAS